MEDNVLLVGMWHYIVPEKGLPVSITGELCPVDAFKTQLYRIQERFTVVTPKQVIENMEAGRILPPNPLLLTFDDGTKDHYLTVLPILQEMGMPATFFILTAPLANKIPSTFKLQLICGNTDSQVLRQEIFPNALKRYGLEKCLQGITSGTYYNEPQEIGEVKWTCNVILGPTDKDAVVNYMFQQLLPEQESELVQKMFLNASDIKVLRRAGMTIGSHGVNHHTMSTLIDELVKQELQESKACLENILGEQITCLGYPGCQPPSNMELVKDAGYQACFTCNINPPVNQPPYNHLALRRIHEKDLTISFLT